jgi:uncharacterized protein YpuA (DUF1002 family)
MIEGDEETVETPDAPEAPEKPEAGIPDERQPSTPLKDWRENITNPKLRNSAGKFTSLDALVESYNKMGGELKSRIRVPGEDASEEDVAKFRKALGVPNSAEEYALTPPEGKEYDEADLAIISEFAEVALEHNVPAAAFSAFMQKLAERASGLRENVAEQIEDAREEAEEALHKEWGNDFDKNVQMATRAAKAHGGTEFVKFLNSTKVEGYGLLGDHPDMVKFLAQIGSKSDEHDMVLHSSASERQSAQDEIREIQEKYQVGSQAYNSPKVQKRLQQLFATVAGENPISGQRL